MFSSHLSSGVEAIFSLHFIDELKNFVRLYPLGSDRSVYI